MRPAHGGPHRVYVGQWFLTPQYAQLRQRGARGGDRATRAAELVALVDGQRLRYFVAATQAAPPLASALGARVERTVELGELSVLVLAPASAADPQ